MANMFYWMVAIATVVCLELSGVEGNYDEEAIFENEQPFFWKSQPRFIPFHQKRGKRTDQEDMKTIHERTKTEIKKLMRNAELLRQKLISDLPEEFSSKRNQGKKRRNSGVYNLLQNDYNANNNFGGFHEEVDTRGDPEPDDSEPDDSELENPRLFPLEQKVPNKRVVDQLKKVWEETMAAIKAFLDKINPFKGGGAAQAPQNRYYGNNDFVGFEEEVGATADQDPDLKAFLEKINPFKRGLRDILQPKRDRYYGNSDLMGFDEEIGAESGEEPEVSVETVEGPGGEETVVVRIKEGTKRFQLRSEEFLE